MTAKIKQLAAALFSRQWWWVTLLVVGIMIGLARLGIWQLDRLDERRESNRELAAALAQAPLDLGRDQLPVNLESVENRLAVAEGRFDIENQVMLKVQNWQGMAGAHLITPLVFEDEETAVLVDRGWIPESDNNPQGREKYNISGPVEVRGYIAKSQTLPQSTVDNGAAAQDQWYRVDVAGIENQLPYELLPVYLLQEPGDNIEPPFRSEPDIEISEGNHFSYAMQWFIFSIGLGIGYLAFVNKQIGKPETS